MTDHTSCTDCQERLEEFALDELEGGDRAQVAAHLESGCVDCNGRLAELVATLALVAQTVPPTEPPVRIERELFARIAAGQNEVRTEASASAASRRPTRIAIALAAALACVAFLLDRPTPQPTTVVGGWAELEQRILAAQHEQQPLPRAQLKFVSRQSDVAADPQVFGHVVEDRLANQCHVFIQNLPPLADGREYRLWFVLADGGYLPAGSVRPDRDGSVSTILELPTAGGVTVALGISSENVAEPLSPGPDLLQAPL